MRSRLPTRQLAITARRSCLSNPATPNSTTLPVTVSRVPSSNRAKWSFSNLNPFARQNQMLDRKEGKELDKLDVRKTLSDSLRGSFKGSIFDEAQPQDAEGAAQEDDDRPVLPSDVTGFGDLPKPTATELVTDPDPRARIRLQRKLVAQMVRRGAKPATREQRIAQTERVMAFTSPWMATGVKKLGMLARQVGGKTIEDALVQMKFSKKKFAREIAYNLREARDWANVKHGMGLGLAVPQKPGSLDPATNSQVREKRRKIQTKDGKWINVPDPTRMYIDEVWVNRGPFRPVKPDYKGRGRFGIIRPPTTSITFRLKEERTRVRQFDERQAKMAQAKPWVHLPDRPITAQRPYYSW